MYFASLDSYHAALESANIAVLVVKSGGTEFISSSVPIDSMSGLLADIEEFYGSKGPLMLWNKDSSELVSLSYEKVDSISIKLLKRP